MIKLSAAGASEVLLPTEHVFQSTGNEHTFHV